MTTDPANLPPVLRPQNPPAHRLADLAAHLGAPIEQP